MRPCHSTYSIASCCPGRSAPCVVTRTSTSIILRLRSGSRCNRHFLRSILPSKVARELRPHSSLFWSHFPPVLVAFPQWYVHWGSHERKIYLSSSLFFKTYFGVPTSSSQFVPGLSLAPSKTYVRFLPLLHPYGARDSSVLPQIHPKEC